MAENNEEKIELSKFVFQGDGEKKVNNWKKMEQIGNGGYSNVYRAKAFTTNDECEIAVKEIKLTMDKNEKNLKSFETEINALAQLSHERIVTFYGCCQEDFYCFIFIEYIPLGSLYDYIRIKEIMRKDRVHLFTKQLLEGIQYLHSQRVIHRDIKTGNILMSSKKSIKLTDFGLSKIFNEFSKASTTGVGTIRNMAPEMFSGSYSYPVDIWALGCVLVEMLTGNFPFSKLKEGQQVMHALCNEKKSPLEYVEQKLPDLAKQFLNKIFKYKPEERHLAGDLLQNDPYITKPYNNLQMESNGMLQIVTHCRKNPGHRDFISVKDFTLQHLPEGLRDKDLYELIQVVAILTMKVSVRRVSYNRPEFYPNSKMPFPFYKMAGNTNLRTGSGEIFALFHYVNGHTSDINPNILIPQIDFRYETYKTCTCHMCQHSDSPSNEWYEIFATTNIINVFDETEARHTTCRLFYDVDDSPVVLLDKVSIVMADVETGLCVIKCVTCDKAPGEKLQEMCERKNVLMEQILKKYKNTTDKLCFIVSHPHGCSKQVTIGQWVDNEKLLDFNENIDLTRLTYTTATCPGSAGASVYCVGMKHAHNHLGRREQPRLTYTTATCPGSAGASVYCVGMKHAHNHLGRREQPRLTYTTATCPGSAGASVYCVGMKHAHNHLVRREQPRLNGSIGYYYKN